MNHKLPQNFINKKPRQNQLYNPNGENCNKNYG